MIVEVMKVTAVPAQTGFADAPTDILTGRFGFTVMVRPLDVDGFPIAQRALLTSIQLMTSLFCGG